ncbi:MAG: hypothetical protein K0B02_01745 [DPANN group archaeon]|nr:hypothetical protein [DPANN group archaeon]
MITNYSNIKTFIFSLDDTIWKWNELYPHVNRVISTLKNRGKKIYYITSNSISTREQIAQRLTKLGIKTGEKEIISTGYVCAKYFEENNIDEVYVVGESGLIKELNKYGISIKDDAKHVLIGTDRNFTYWKLKKIYDLVDAGAKLYTTGLDSRWSVGDEIYPGALPFSTAVKTFTGKNIQLLGSPSGYMKERILNDIFLFPEDTILIGSNISTDIKLGNISGLFTGVLVHDNANMEKIENAVGDEKPSTIITDIREIMKGL